MVMATGILTDTVSAIRMADTVVMGRMVAMVIRMTKRNDERLPAFHGADHYEI